MNLAIVINKNITYRFIYCQIGVYQYMLAVSLFKKIPDFGQQIVNQCIVRLFRDISSRHIFEALLCTILCHTIQVLIQNQIYHVHCSEMSSFQKGIPVWHLCPDFLAVYLAAIEIDKHLLELWQGEFPDYIRTLTVFLRVLITALRIAIYRNFILLI